MSRIGKLLITVPAGVTVVGEKEKAMVTGPKGSVPVHIPWGVTVKQDGEIIRIEVENEEMDNLQGLTRSLVANAVKGVTEGWKKVLELSGTGYRASATEKELQMALGFSHPVIVKAPEGISFAVLENKITVSGADKALVGEIAARIRKWRKADPYKLKGLKYEGEVIIKKAGKAAKVGGAPGAK